MFNLQDFTGIAESEAVHVAATDLVRYFGNSVCAGVLLVLVTIWAAQKLPSTTISTDLQPDDNSSSGKTPASEIFSSEAFSRFYQQMEGRVNITTVVFLCVGMTGVMALVSNSLARAFAVGAAISLVRFRIRLDKPGLNTALFFSVLVGMACGADQIPLAWVLTGLFTIMQVTIVLLAIRWINKQKYLHLQIHEAKIIKTTNGLAQSQKVANDKIPQPQSVDRDYTQPRVVIPYNVDI